jgi:hypothetical protein
VITNRLHSKQARAAFFPKYPTRGKPTLWLIGAELYRNLTAYTVGSFDDTHHYFNCSLRSLAYLIKP